MLNIEEANWNFDLEKTRSNDSHIQEEWSFMKKLAFAQICCKSFVALCCLGWSASTLANVITFQEDISPTNTYQAGAIDISLATPNDNRELALNPLGDPLPSLFIGRVSATSKFRGLFFFDLSAIPAGSTINSASLSVFAQRNNSGGTVLDTSSVNQNFDIYLHQLVGSITEGDPTTYSISGPSWNSRDISTATAWTTPGGDYNSTVLSTLTANPRQLVGGQAYTWNSTSDFVAAAQGALNGSGVLYMLARASSEDLALRGEFRFMSDDQAPNNSAILSDVHTNPILTVDYTPAPEPSTLVLLVLGTAAVAFCRTMQRKNGYDRLRRLVNRELSCNHL